eukprot:2084327-Pyramimonas_sp.AAC.2
MELHGWGTTPAACLYLALSTVLLAHGTRALRPCQHALIGFSCGLHLHVRCFIALGAAAAADARRACAM